MTADIKYMQPCKEWDTIAKAKWAETCTNTKRPSQNIPQLKRAWIDACDSKHDIIKASQFAREAMSALYKRVNDYEKQNDTTCGDYGGDDSFGDMLYHVVGSGQELYVKIMLDPRELNSVKYEESFAYVLMTNWDDFEEFDEGYWVERAVSCLGALYLAERNLNELAPASQAIVKELQERFVLMTEGKFTEACGDMNDELYNKYYKWQGNNECARYANCLSDAKKCLL